MPKCAYCSNRVSSGPGCFWNKRHYLENKMICRECNLEYETIFGLISPAKEVEGVRKEERKRRDIKTITPSEENGRIKEPPEIFKRIDNIRKKFLS